jgi:hypothetical protein
MEGESASWLFKCSCGIECADFDDGSLQWQCGSCNVWSHAQCNRRAAAKRAKTGAKRAKTQGEDHVCTDCEANRPRPHWLSRRLDDVPDEILTTILGLISAADIYGLISASKAWTVELEARSGSWSQLCVERLTDFPKRPRRTWMRTYVIHHSPARHHVVPRVR